MARRYTYDIVDGPSKSEIELAFYGSRRRRVSEVMFAIGSGKEPKKLFIIITDVVKMNGDGLLLIKGIYESDERVGRVLGLFSTETRKGRMRIIP